MVAHRGTCISRFAHTPHRRTTNRIIRTGDRVRFGCIIRDFIVAGAEGGAMRCAECGTEDERVQGWRALLGEDGDRSLMVAVFCPECAEQRVRRRSGFRGRRGIADSSGTLNCGRLVSGWVRCHIGGGEASVSQPGRLPLWLRFAYLAPSSAAATICETDMNGFIESSRRRPCLP